MSNAPDYAAEIDRHFAWFQQRLSPRLAAFVGWRMSRRGPVPLGAREAFVNLPATSPRLAEIDPRSAERQ